MAATDQFYRKQYTLDIVFAVSCLLMLVSIVWMFAQDYYREFKTVQREFRDVDEALTERTMLEKIPDAKQVSEARDAVARAREDLQDVKDAIETEMRNQRPVKAQQEADVQKIKANYDSKTSLYNIAVENRDALPLDHPRRSALEKAVNERQREVNGLEQEMMQAQKNLDATNEKIKQLQTKKLKELADPDFGRPLFGRPLAIAVPTGKPELGQKSQKLAENELSNAEDQLKKVSGEFDRFAKATAQKKWKWGDTIRKMPVIDGFASPVKIQQYTLAEYPIDYSFKYVTRYDRCTTCHLGMELPGFEKAALKKLTPDNVPGGLQTKLDEVRELFARRAKEGEKETIGFDPSDLPKTVRTVNLSNAQINEFCVHPRLDLFVDANSPHPAEKFGCSSCHGGQGSATDFLFASHTPNNAAQRHEWAYEHGWEHYEFWDYPMLAKRFVESSCLKCHHQVTDLIRSGNKLEAPKLIRGYNLVRETGCFGCHEIAGIKSAREVGPDLRLEPSPPLESYTPAERVKMLSDPLNPPGTLRKVGPSLYRLSEKTNRQWTRKWIAAPRDFRPTTKMPHFYGLSNNRPDVLPEDQKNFPDAEVASIAHYLFTESRDYLRGEDKYRSANKSRIEELQDKKQKKLASEKEMKDLEELTRRLQLDERPRPLSAKEIIDAEGKKVLLPAAPVDDKAKQDQLRHGRQLFSERGCLACHSNKATEKAELDLPAVASDADFAPELSRIAAKIAPEGGGSDAKRLWLVQWILDPRIHHPRTRMPITHLTVDQAADVAAWLLSLPIEGWNQPDFPEPSREALTELARVYLLKTPGMTRGDAEVILKGEASKRRGIVKDMHLPPDADETALAGPELTDDSLKWYIGRKAINRLGCYGCHEVPGFASAKPIGTPLNDWGKKDPERLAFEDIAAYANEHYHGVNGNQGGQGHETHRGNGTKPYDQFFLDALQHHQREGFLHQKLVEPRSYDYNRLRTWDDRLRMPQFKFARGQAKRKGDESQEQADEREEVEAREAVMTFILGLVAEPVPFKYLNDPPPDRAAEVKGRQVLDKYNCAGCHQIRPGIYEFKNSPDLIKQLDESYQNASRTYASDHLFPEHTAWAGQLSTRPDRLTAFAIPQASQGATQLVRLIDALRYRNPTNELRDIPAGSMIGIGPDDIRPEAVLAHSEPYGGTFAELLVGYLGQRDATLKEYKNARAALPPSLFREGEKVQPAWLFQFLRNPQPVRPQRDWKAGTGMVILRMPQFNMSDEEAMALVNYFAAVDKMNNPGEGLSYPYVAIAQQGERYWQKKSQDYLTDLGKEKVEQRLSALKPTWEQMLREQIADLQGKFQTAEAAVKNAKPDEKKDAERLRDALKQELDRSKDQAAKKDYDTLNKAWLQQEAYAADAYRLLTSYNTPCLSCHQVGSFPPKVLQGPPLNLAAERLRPDWTLRWLANPDRLISYPTPMPQNFAKDAKDLYPEFAGTPFQQATAVRDVLMYFPKVAEMPANRYYRPATGEGGK